MKKFPDKNKDGKVTKADVLMAKGVIPAKKGMKHGGMAKKKMMGGGMTKMAKGGGIESKGKTKGKMITMKSGGKAC